MYAPLTEENFDQIQAGLADGSIREWRRGADGTEWYTDNLPEIRGVAPDIDAEDYGPHDDAIEHIEAEDDDENVLACPHCGGHFQVPPHE